ncbi:HIR complex subunit [Neophaeococcomyces mojaviensis]|uniref:HIR complex subunit n=1 Tax=Neophaeococcomyces mojaviensis TaxID=3383035 RepID=A0ACC3A5E2_9EURO|nr:HIR complex subunit [Knufia sp. JES_112]
MEVDTRSSSNELSSAPSSDIEGPFPSIPFHSNTITVARDTHTSSTPANAANAKFEGASAQASATRQDNAPVKQRKPRKKKEVDPNAPPAPEKKKATRKPRESATTTSNARKKQKTENTVTNGILPQHATATTDLSSSRLVQPFVSESKPTIVNEAAKISQNGFSNHTSAMNSQPPSPPVPRYQTTPQQQPAAPRSRNIFDPVRGIERASEQTQTITYPSLNETPPRQPFRPSASPAISSMLNPTDAREIPPLTYQPPAKTIPSRSNVMEEIKAINNTIPTVINLDSSTSSEGPSKKTIIAEKITAELEAKPKKVKEQPPSISAGSGLLNSTFFGGEHAHDKSESTSNGTSIMLHINLKDPKNKIFNFARMAEEKYGFAVVYPRQAAQKKRLAEVAAQGAALERTALNSKRGGTSAGDSGDEDLSVDIDRDSDNDGDVTMGGINGTNENSGTDGNAPKQRKKRRDEYDADDPFVDDSEMLWEAQAAASKDGFFVYCGPLVPEGEKPTVERADGTAKRGRGRGRGGGPGSRGGRGAAAASSSVGEVPSKGVSGSRGGGVTRKPRITKAERAQRELEKKQREQMALAAKPPTIPV